MLSMHRMSGRTRNAWGVKNTAALERAIACGRALVDIDPQRMVFIGEKPPIYRPGTSSSSRVGVTWRRPWPWPSSLAGGLESDEGCRRRDLRVNGRERQAHDFSANGALLA
jgi:hypothetical protein